MIDYETLYIEAVRRRDEMVDFAIKTKTVLPTDYWIEAYHAREKLIMYRQIWEIINNEPVL